VVVLASAFGGRRAGCRTPADNTTALAEAPRRRSQRIRSDAEKAIAAAQRTGDQTTFAAIAKTAGVSRSWLYTQHDHVTAIRQLQNRQPATERTGSQPASVTSLRVDSRPHSGVSSSYEPRTTTSPDD
jgi:hypothetical protein